MSILFLIGPRGCGKTSAAGNMGRLFGCRHCDVDAIVVASAGKSIADIVRDEGWSAFRALEKTSLLEAVRRMSEGAAEEEFPAVIATGGGIVLDPENRAVMRENGTVVHLAASPEVIIRRLEKSLCDASRPPLSSLEFTDEIRSVMAEREKLYRETAHHRVDAAMKPEQLARALLALAGGAAPGAGTKEAAS